MSIIKTDQVFGLFEGITDSIVKSSTNLWKIKQLNVLQCKAIYTARCGINFITNFFTNGVRYYLKWGKLLQFLLLFTTIIINFKKTRQIFCIWYFPMGLNTKCSHRKSKSSKSWTWFQILIYFFNFRYIPTNSINIFWF